jgi:hypothetical protein
MTLQKFSCQYYFSDALYICTHLYLFLTYLLTYVINYYMEQGHSGKANQFPTSQEIPRTLWNTKVHYLIHKCPSLVPVLIVINPIHAPIPLSTSWRSILILSSHLRLGLLSGLSLRFPHQNAVYASPLPHTYYIPRPSYSRFDNPNNVWWGVQVTNLLFICTYLFSPLYNLSTDDVIKHSFVFLVTYK